MHKIKKTKLGLMVALALSSSAVNAEWTAATDDHKLISDIASISHITTRNDGGHFVSYVREMDRMDVYIRSLDAKGNILWDEESLVFDRDMGYAYDYGLVALDNGAARLVIRNMAGGDWNDEIYDYDPTIESLHLFETNADGTQRWPEGLQVNTDADTIAIGTPTIHAHGNQSIVTWDQSFEDHDDDPWDGGNVVSRVALYNEAGEAVWTVSNVESSYSVISDTYIAHDGVVVVYFNIDDNAIKSLHGHISIQKYSFEDGKPMWGETPTYVTSGADLELNTFNPKPYLKIQEDEEGGVAFAWRVPTQSGAIDVFQHFNKDGEARFTGPVRVSHGKAAYNPSIPQLIVNKTDTYVFWAVQDRNDTGIFARKIDKEGNSVWGEEALTIKPMTSGDDSGFTGYSDIVQASVHEGHINLYFNKIQDYWPSTLNAIQVNFDGTLGEEVAVNSVVDSHSLVKISRTNTGEDVLSWVDGGWGDGYLYTTNVNADMTSGLLEGISLHRNVDAFLAMEDEAKTLTLSFLDSMSVDHTVALTSTSDELTISDVEQASGTVNATFTTSADFSGETTFELTVTDNNDLTRTATKSYRFINTNTYDAPIVELPREAEAKEESAVAIPFVFSSDTGDLDVQWIQTRGPDVTFTTNSSVLEFVAPAVDEDTYLAFTATVSDGVSTIEKAVVVKIIDLPNHVVPVIELAAEVRFRENTQASIPYVISYEGDTELNVEWIQTSGSQISFTVSENTIEFDTPSVDADAQYTFTAIVNDGFTRVEKSIAVTVVNEVIPDSSSGGSFGWLLTGLAAVGLTRRRNKKNNA